MEILLCRALGDDKRLFVLFLSLVVTSAFFYYIYIHANMFEHRVVIYVSSEMQKDRK